ncbi:hypothetical protein ACFQZ1_02890 [Bacillus sp. CGMCC 1.60114]|uniref:hypothetical protein n=1 Tax=unclassified Bacillus (in: firmicutes) TaxID=185979 RepID=UPI00363DFD12
MEILVGTVLFIVLFWIIVKVVASSERKRAQKQYRSDATDSTYTATPFFFAGPSESSGDCDSSFGGDGGDGGSCGGD